jgi:hypothetical protein
VNRRIFISLALLVFTALPLAACGGGSSDADKITETIEKAATTSDPSNCTELETLNFVEQNNQEQGKAALKTCEEEAEAEQEQAEGANVSNVSVDGEKATAEVEFEGGGLGQQSLEVALIKDEGNWKLDQIEGFANYDGKALGEAFEKQFEEEEELTPEQTKCIAGKVAEASQAEAEELFFSGNPEKIIELSQGCAGSQ